MFRKSGTAGVLIDIGIVGWFSASSIQRSRLKAGLQSLWRSWQSWPSEKRGRWAGLALFGALVLGMQLPIAAPLRALVVGEPSIVAIAKVDSELFLNQETTGAI